MSNINKHWIGVSHLGARGISYVRLQDVERVSINPVKSENKDETKESFEVTVFAQGVEFLYTKSSNNTDADKSAHDVLNKVEISLGRGEA